MLMQYKRGSEDQCDEFVAFTTLVVTSVCIYSLSAVEV